jgi:hypothetical protein
MSQRRLDKIGRLRPELLGKIAVGELSIKGALKLCEQPQEKIEKKPSIDQLKRIFSNLSESGSPSIPGAFAVRLVERLFTRLFRRLIPSGP